MGEVQNILKAAFGKDLVTETTFRIDTDGEEMRYWEGDYLQLNNPPRYLIGNKGQHLEAITAFNTCVVNGEKSFLFYTFEKCPDHVFSLELINYDSTRQLDLLKCSNIDSVNNSSEDIIRIDRKAAFMVAIRIGPVNDRNYTALKHYVLSSDNRTYNKIVRSTVEYIRVNSEEFDFHTDPKLPVNILVSGAPGTGKSHYLNKKVIETGKDIIDQLKAELTVNDSDTALQSEAIQRFCDEYVTRVTFYEDYSYENFVGCYKPIPAESTANIKFDSKTGEIREEKITYRFIPGPFVNSYINAWNDKDNNYYLIIEEINRAKAASVFGDMFQLLDRKDGMSEYDITPDAELNNYLSKNVTGYDGKMKLPPNLYIWATMNSADQGVMPLDSAFKRRWSQIYMDIDSSNVKGSDLHLPKDGEIKTILWDNLRKEINRVILEAGFDEDRCIGSWYFKDEEIQQINDYFTVTEEERRSKVNPLIDKLLYYLRQDVFRRNPSLIFSNENNEGITMSAIRHRVCSGEAIDTLLRIQSLTWSHNDATDNSNKENE